MPELWWKRVGRSVLKCAVGSAAFVLFFRWFELQQVYHPTGGLKVDVSKLGVSCEEVWLLTSDQIRLNAWYFPASKDSLRRDKAVLFCHGNGGNLSHRMITYDILLKLGLNVLAFDYRGYGASGGSPSEEGTYLDGTAAFAWLERRGFKPSNILVMGESLGGGVAAELAVRHSPGGVILQSTFTSVPDLGSELFPWLPVRTFGRISYGVRDKLPRIQCPMLILHSRVDTLIGFQHAEANFAAARGPKKLVELTGDHNDAPGDDPESFLRGIEVFLTDTLRW